MIAVKKNFLKALVFALSRKIYLILFWKFPSLMPSIQQPHFVEIELTNSCNMSCSHCQRRNMKRKVGFMNMELFEKIIDEIAQYPLRFVRIVGLGEPSQNPNLGQMIEYAKQRNVNIELTTNGNLFEQYTPQEILKWNIDVLGVSVDGVDEETYHSIRKNGNYQKLRQNLLSFHAIREKEASKLPLLKIRNVLFPGYSPDSVLAFKNQWIKISDHIAFNTFNPNKSFQEYTQFNRCTDLFFTAHVRWDGKVPLCSHQFIYTNDEWIGDLNNQSLKEIWKSDRLKEVRKMHQQRDLHNLNFCRLCSNTHNKKTAIENSRNQNSSNIKFLNFTSKLVRIS